MVYCILGFVVHESAFGPGDKKDALDSCGAASGEVILKCGYSSVSWKVPDPEGVGCLSGFAWRAKHLIGGLLSFELRNWLR